jgi:hypothetical protein
LDKHQVTDERENKTVAENVQLQLPPHGLALAAATVSFAIGAADGDGPSSRL